MGPEVLVGATEVVFGNEFGNCSGWIAVAGPNGVSVVGFLVQTRCSRGCLIHWDVQNLTLHSGAEEVTV